ncbi:hypothetical protein DFH07DRAFT_769761 [Mycena maculata]|uniref:Uncharacterized protein n=1 Tax=Mycena maculata TaxID=230809 RepID=A0AAD7JKK8_9AGAR|nr:hypothetical protein DFH07DRAFT_769761 [Mycena maculata]
MSEYHLTRISLLWRRSRLTRPNLWLKESRIPEEAEYNISVDIFLSLIAHRTQKWKLAQNSNFLVRAFGTAISLWDQISFSLKFLKSDPKKCTTPRNGTIRWSALVRGEQGITFSRALNLPGPTEVYGRKIRQGIPSVECTDPRCFIWHVLTITNLNCMPHTQVNGYVLIANFSHALNLPGPTEVYDRKIQQGIPSVECTDPRCSIWHVLTITNLNCMPHTQVKWICTYRQFLACSELAWTHRSLRPQDTAGNSIRGVHRSTSNGYVLIANFSHALNLPGPTEVYDRKIRQGIPSVECTDPRCSIWHVLTITNLNCMPHTQVNGYVLIANFSHALNLPGPTEVYDRKIQQGIPSVECTDPRCSIWHVLTITNLNCMPHTQVNGYVLIANFSHALNLPGPTEVYDRKIQQGIPSVECTDPRCSIWHVLTTTNLNGKPHTQVNGYVPTADLSYVQVRRIISEFRFRTIRDIRDLLSDEFCPVVHKCSHVVAAPDADRSLEVCEEIGRLVGEMPMVALRVMVELARDDKNTGVQAVLIVIFFWGVNKTACRARGGRQFITRADFETKANERTEIRLELAEPAEVRTDQPLSGPFTRRPEDKRQAEHSVLYPGATPESRSQWSPALNPENQARPGVDI